MEMVVLTPYDLIIMACLVILLAAMSFKMQLGIGPSLLIASVRTVIQLILIGMVLRLVFDNAELVWVLMIAVVMLLVAGREVVARQRRRFLGRWGYGMGTLSMFVSTFVITIPVLILVIGVEPWYSPQYAIPLFGMMFGNTMNGIALAIDRMTQMAWDQRHVIETRLMLGETWVVAIADIRHEATRVGMVPMINAMATAGLVSLPGMMTGQILAGIDPMEAVMYQILIMFMITVGTGLGTMIAVMAGSRRLFDDRERLRLDRLSPAKGSKR